MAFVSAELEFEFKLLVPVDFSAYVGVWDLPPLAFFSHSQTKASSLFEHPQSSIEETPCHSPSAALEPVLKAEGRCISSPRWPFQRSRELESATNNTKIERRQI
jgi:hypothetical protein